MITLHHGSNVPIVEIDLSKSKRGKDFGRGFYLNPDYTQALKWAQTRVDFYLSGEAIVTSFSFDIAKAKAEGLKIKIFEDYTSEWAEFVVANRKNKSDNPLHEFDIVIGPIADDSVGTQIRRFMLGYISVEELVDEIRYNGDRAVQYYFGTPKALGCLKHL